MRSPMMTKGRSKPMAISLVAELTTVSVMGCLPSSGWGSDRIEARGNRGAGIVLERHRLPQARQESGRQPLNASRTTFCQRLKPASHGREGGLSHAHLVDPR